MMVTEAAQELRYLRSSRPDTTLQGGWSKNLNPVSSDKGHYQIDPNTYLATNKSLKYTFYIIES
jgi:hypothetical protein